MGLTLSESELATAWAPRCSGNSLRIALHGAGAVVVNPTIGGAVLCLDACLVAYDYRTRAADTGAYVCRHKVGCATCWSLHAYKVALDLNWTTNPYGPNLHTDFPRALIDAILAIRTNTGKQVWTWGGDWRGNKDPMHFQIACSPRDLATGINMATVPGQHPAAPVPSAQKPTAAQEAAFIDAVYTSQANNLTLLFAADYDRAGNANGFPTIGEGASGDWVRMLQGVERWLTGEHLPIDGVCGASTVDIVRRTQRIAGAPETGVADQSFWKVLRFLVYVEAKRRQG